MLFGCIHAFDFAVQALGLGRPHSFLTDPIAVLDGPEQALKVFASNRSARQQGIYAGMKKMQAEACLGVRLRKREFKQEQTAQALLLDCGFAFSSQVEATEPGTIIADLTGSERVFGTPIKLAHQLKERATACGFQVNAALASNPDVALHAARGFSGVTVIPKGEETEWLAALAVDVLEPDEGILDTFNSWGIRTFRALSALPTNELIQRLGQQGLHLQRLAKGEVQRELVPTQPAASFHESLELEEPVEMLEPLELILHQLLERVISRLTMRALATDYVQLDLELEVHADRQLKAISQREELGGVHQRILKLPVPMQDVKIIWKLLQLDLAAHPPHAAVRNVRVEAFPARIRSGQPGLFQSLAPEPAKLEITMARLRAVVGERDERGRDLVGFAAVMDCHKPDSFQVFPSSEEARAASKVKEKTESQMRPLFPINIFRPPITAKVFLKDGVPESVIFQENRARVLKASGPWRINGDWWNQSKRWDREEWDLELQMKNRIGIYRFFHDQLSNNWFADGMYSSGELLQAAVMGPQANEVVQRLIESRAHASLNDSDGGHCI